MGKFKKEFCIPFYDSNKFGNLSPVSIIRYLGETSEAHSEHQNIGLDELRKNNYGWILYRWKVKIDYYPSVKDKIIIETWTSSFYKFYAYREFLIYDSNMKEIGRARTLWIFIDTEKKRPIRIPKEFNGIYDILDERVFEGFWDLQDEIEISYTLDFHVRKSDIDYNQHVNNSNYLEWITETISEEIEEEHFLSEFEILYKNETLYGETISSQRDEGTHDGDTIIFNHKIVNKEDKKERTIARTIWKKR